MHAATSPSRPGGTRPSSGSRRPRSRESRGSRRRESRDSSRLSGTKLSASRRYAPEVFPNESWEREGPCRKVLTKAEGIFASKRRFHTGVDVVRSLRKGEGNVIRPTPDQADFGVTCRGAIYKMTVGLQSQSVDAVRYKVLLTPATQVRGNVKIPHTPGKIAPGLTRTVDVYFLAVATGRVKEAFDVVTEIETYRIYITATVLRLDAFHHHEACTRMEQRALYPKNVTVIEPGTRRPEDPDEEEADAGDEPPARAVPGVSGARAARVSTASFASSARDVASKKGVPLRTARIWNRIEAAGLLRPVAEAAAPAPHAPTGRSNVRKAKSFNASAMVAEEVNALGPNPAQSERVLDEWDIEGRKPEEEGFYAGFTSIFRPGEVAEKVAADEEDDGMHAVEEASKVDYGHTVHSQVKDDTDVMELMALLPAVDGLYFDRTSGKLVLDAGWHAARCVDPSASLKQVRRYAKEKRRERSLELEAKGKVTAKLLKRLQKTGSLVDEEAAARDAYNKNRKLAASIARKAERELRGAAGPGDRMAERSARARSQRGSLQSKPSFKGALARAATLDVGSLTAVRDAGVR